MIQFTKRHFQYAYVEGAKVTLSAKEEKELIEGGYAVKVAEKATKKTAKKPRTATKKI